MPDCLFWTWPLSRPWSSNRVNIGQTSQGGNSSCCHLPFSTNIMCLLPNSSMFAFFFVFVCFVGGRNWLWSTSWVGIFVFSQWWKWCWKDRGCQIHHELHLQSVGRRSQSPGELVMWPLLKPCTMWNMEVSIGLFNKTRMFFLQKSHRFYNQEPWNLQRNSMGWRYLINNEVL